MPTTRIDMLLTAAWPLPDDDPIIYAYNVAQGVEKSGKAAHRSSSKTMMVSPSRGRGQRQLQTSAKKYETPIADESEDGAEDTVLRHRQREVAQQSTPEKKRTSTSSSSKTAMTSVRVGKYSVQYETNAILREDNNSTVGRGDDSLSRGREGGRPGTLPPAPGAIRNSPGATTPIRKVLEREREREHAEDLKKIEPFIQPLRSPTKTMAVNEKEPKRKKESQGVDLNASTTTSRSPTRAHQPQWQGGGIPEQVFSYDGLHDPNLQGYYLRSLNARKALISHGVITAEGDAVNMHHVGGQIWLSEKRHHQRERSMQIAEERLRTEQMHDRRRQLEALAQIERSGKVNRMRVASHIAYTRKREARNKEQELVMREKVAKQQARRKAMEMHMHSAEEGGAGSQGRGVNQKTTSRPPSAYSSATEGGGGVTRRRSTTAVVAEDASTSGRLPRGSSVLRRRPTDAAAASPTVVSSPPLDWGLLASSDPRHTTCEVTVTKRPKKKQRPPDTATTTSSAMRGYGSDPERRKSIVIHTETEERRTQTVSIRHDQNGWSDGEITPQEVGLSTLQSKDDVEVGTVVDTETEAAAAASS